MIAESIVEFERRLSAQLAAVPDPADEAVPSRRRELEEKRRVLDGRRHAAASALGRMRNLSQKHLGIFAARESLTRLLEQMQAEAETADERTADGVRQRIKVLTQGWRHEIPTSTPPVWLALGCPGVDVSTYSSLNLVEGRLATLRKGWLNALAALAKAGDLPEDLQGIVEDARQELLIRSQLDTESIDDEERARLEKLLSLLEAEYDWPAELEAAREPRSLAEAA